MKSEEDEEKKKKIKSCFLQFQMAKSPSLPPLVSLDFSSPDHHDDLSQPPFSALCPNCAASSFCKSTQPHRKAPTRAITASFTIDLAGISAHHRCRSLLSIAQMRDKQKKEKN
jgi:hypothetical protein